MDGSQQLLSIDSLDEDRNYQQLSTIADTSQQLPAIANYSQLSLFFHDFCPRKPFIGELPTLLPLGDCLTVTDISNTCLSHSCL